MSSSSILARLCKHPSIPSTLGFTRYTQRASPLNWHKAYVGSDCWQDFPAPCPAMRELHSLHVYIARRPKPSRITPISFQRVRAVGSPGWQMGEGGTRQRWAAHPTLPFSGSFCAKEPQKFLKQGRSWVADGTLLVAPPKVPRVSCFNHPR